MRKQFSFFLKIMLFWLSYFLLLRAAFLVYLSTTLRAEPFTESVKALWFGLRMDIAATAYLLAIPLLLFCVWQFIANNKWQKVFRIFNYVTIAFCALLNSADMGLFGEWETRINSKALSYLAFPKETLMATSAAPVWLLLILAFVLAAIGIFAFKKLLKLPSGIYVSKVIYKISMILIVLPSLFFMLRGGFQKYPINKGSVYFSDKPALNIAAINTFWNFFEILVNPRITKNPYVFMDQKVAEKITAEIFALPVDSTEMLFTVAKPNIVLIMMESLSAETMTALGGEKGISPGLDSLCKQGLLFSNFYATGFRTEQGLIALLSAFPAQPASTIIRNFGKFEKLDISTLVLKENGYVLSYYYGGVLTYANTNHYLKMGEFTTLAGREDFPETSRSTDWGVYDDILFNYHLKEVGKQNQPFFSIVMTSTNHEPFDGKVEKVFPGKDECSAYKNTSHFADKCLFQYLQTAKCEPWYANTVFVITGDHAHKYPQNRQYNEAERHHTPLLILGAPLKEAYRGKIISTTSSHLDFAATLFAQLGIKTNKFPWSRNLMNPTCGNFAFYTFDNGFGVVSGKQALIYDHNVKKIIYTKNKTVTKAEDDKLLNKGKAFLQVMFQKYIDLDN